MTELRVVGARQVQDSRTWNVEVSYAVPPVLHSHIVQLFAADSFRHLAEVLVVVVLTVSRHI